VARLAFGTRDRPASLLALAFLVAGVLGCGGGSPTPTAGSGPADGGPRLALWLAKKDELIVRADATYDLVMSGWFEKAEADAIASRQTSTRLLAGLSHTWTLDDPSWLSLLVTIANGGDAKGPLQIADDMFLMLDANKDGKLDRKCTLPGWDGIRAMDPRHPGWRKLILAFYENVAEQAQHGGAIVDMVDAHPFCDGGWSGGVSTPIDTATWVSAQDELLGLIRSKVPADKWLIANAGHDFAAGSPFPKHVNGYVLENFLGSWGANLEEGLASAKRALETTQAPHVVVFAVDTDDTGKIDWLRFRTGLAASLLMDNSYFAFDYGSKDHGGVAKWWFPEYYKIALGDSTGPFSLAGGVYRRDFERGVVVVAVGAVAHLTFDTQYRDTATGGAASTFDVPRGDARIFLRADQP
jgi:hypothetical protein